MSTVQTVRRVVVAFAAVAARPKQGFVHLDDLTVAVLVDTRPEGVPMTAPAVDQYFVRYDAAVHDGTLHLGAPHRVAELYLTAYPYVRATCPNHAGWDLTWLAGADNHPAGFHCVQCNGRVEFPVTDFYEARERLPHPDMSRARHVLTAQQPAAVALYRQMAAKLGDVPAESFTIPVGYVADPAKSIEHNDVWVRERVLMVARGGLVLDAQRVPQHAEFARTVNSDGETPTPENPGVTDVCFHQSTPARYTDEAGDWLVPVPAGMAVDVGPEFAPVTPGGVWMGPPADAQFAGSREELAMIHPSLPWTLTKMVKDQATQAVPAGPRGVALESRVIGYDVRMCLHGPESAHVWFAPFKWVGAVDPAHLVGSTAAYDGLWPLYAPPGVDAGVGPRGRVMWDLVSLPASLRELVRPVPVSMTAARVHPVRVPRVHPVAQVRPKAAGPVRREQPKTSHPSGLSSRERYRLARKQRKQASRQTAAELGQLDQAIAAVAETRAKQADHPPAAAEPAFTFTLNSWEQG